jgi:hypothetical protein
MSCCFLAGVKSGSHPYLCALNMMSEQMMLIYNGYSFFVKKITSIWKEQL